MAENLELGTAVQPEGQRCRVAVDIGGTFTDFVIQDVASGQISTAKALSTPEDPAIAVLDGLKRFMPEGALLEALVHGTTVGLNALIERRGPGIALVSTKGFSDVYLLAHGDRRDIFSVRYHKPRPFVRPDLAFGVTERVAFDGSVVEDLDVVDLEPLLEAVRRKEVQAVAVCLLFAYLNPVHELAIEAHLKKRAPGLEVTLSHRISPEWREYERTSTTVMNAYIAPVVSRYLTTLNGQMPDRTADICYAIQWRSYDRGVGSAASDSNPVLRPSRRDYWRSTDRPRI